jgi:hypothetical protein
MGRNMFASLAVMSGLVLWQGCEYETLKGPVKCEENPVLLEVVSTSDADCALMDGSIGLSASGGNGPYSFVIDDGAPQADSLFEGLGAGIYQLSAIDVNNCSATDEVTLKNKNGLNIAIDTRTAGCNGSEGGLTVTATDGTEPYQFKIDNGNFSGSNAFEGLSPRDYVLTVKDASGCVVTQKIRINSGISFSASIAPIIEDNCAVSGCHNGSQFPDFRVFKNVHDNAFEIKKLTADGTMPQDGTITQEQINRIACWVDDGAPDN